MRTCALVCLTAAVIGSWSPLRGEDWPQWRGPHRNGVSDERGLQGEWPSGGPRLAWQVIDLGAGYSTPSVVGDRLFVLGNQGLDNEYVQARRVEDGAELWTTRLGNVGNPDQNPNYPGARSTPTVDGDVLFALGSNGDLACVEVETGTIRWARNLRDDFGGQPGEWAYSESPLVDGDRLICTPGGSQATIVALQKDSGELIWKSAIDQADAAYASPIAIEFEGEKQYVQFLASGLVGVDAATGRFLWRYDRTAEGSPANIPTPLGYNGHVYSAAGRSGGGLVRLERNRQGVSAQEVYFSPKLPTGIGGVVRLGQHFFGTNGNVLVCADFLTGEILWQDRSIGASSLCYADGRLYLHGENGEVALVEPSADQYVEKGRFSPANPPERGEMKAWAYPVIANGRLYIRELESLWSYDVRE